MYVNLILKKEKDILGRIGLNFWGFGEQLNYFGDLGSMSKIHGCFISWFYFIYAYTEKLIVISLLFCDSRFGEINDHC